MKKINLFVIALFVFSSAIFAQEKLLSIDDIYNPDPAKRVRFSGALPQLRWAPNGKSLMQIAGGKLLRVDPVSGNSAPYFDTMQFINAAARAGIGARLAQRIVDSGDFTFDAGEAKVLFNFEGDIYLFDIATVVTKRVTNTREEEKEADFSPDAKWVSFVRGNDLYVIDLAKSGEKQLTRDGKEGDKPIYNGYLDWVYEEELYGRGNKRGYWWSPDSTRIAFLRLDESPVSKFILTNDVTQPQVVETMSYPKAGEPNPIVRIGIANVTKNSLMPNVGRIPKVGERLPPTLLRFGDSVQFVDLAAYKPEDLLIARVAWSPDSRAVVFQALNREQTFLDLNSADEKGKVTKLINETTPAWVEVYDNPNFLADGTAVWQSARNGWRHLYLYKSNGELVRQLTNGKWEIRSVHGVDEKNGWVYFSGTKDSHIAENAYRVALTGGEPERLTQGAGAHQVSFNKDLTHFIDVTSDALTPPQMRLYRADGSLERVITENKVEVLKDYRLSNVEFLKVPTRDGFQMEAMMIKPPDFEPSKKYPVFQFTYSGPHAPSVANRWLGSRGMWFQMLAQKGYIVWVCDNRSASGKGEESVWPIYKRMYELELRDLEDGINYLKSTGYVDADRIGIHGWSYGGSMTSYAMNHSKAWKLGIAGGTGTDWRNYDSIYTERYMMTPKSNPEGYNTTSIVRSAAGLSGKLMLIHGQIDDNVHMQNTTQYAYELQKAGKQFDLMIYPTARHGVTDPRQVHHMYTMMTDYILKNL
ncbi:MAG: DPP IV N-terminal domain-containing protein [Pyrinomonadaceae bacterium]|nr:DPP IV N-terminal domain-containing protein [Acidobacteriota bacterium]MBK7932365.1 DPP IV N-terminal domain-containing protein [Acidobacteriota bacterium]MBP7376368.1 DPP IV N-terminal domain-containing protein [Pyrinomonadaceae bacterium]